jgi:hypothetical protein
MGQLPGRFRRHLLIAAVAPLVTAFATLVTAFAPAAARADQAWSATPQQISSAGTNADGLQVATDAAGDAVAVWLQFDPNHNVTRVVEARRPAGGFFGAPAFLSDAGFDAARPYVAMNASGQAVATWDEPDQVASNNGVFRAVAPPGGAFGAQRIVEAGGAQSAEVAVDNAGDVLITYTFPDTSQSTNQDGTGVLIRVAYFPAGSLDIGYQTISTAPTGDSTPQEAEQDVQPQLAMGASGDAVVTWVETYNPLGVPSQAVEAAYRPAGGACSTTCTNGSPGFYQRYRLSDTTVHNAIEPTAAVDSKGEAYVLFMNGDTNGSTGLTIQASYCSRTQQFTQDTTISDPSVNSHNPAVTFDASGNAYATWDQASSNAIEVASAPAGGAFGAPVAITTSGGLSSGPQVGVDGQGRQTVLWTDQDSSANNTVKVATRVAGSGAFGATTSLSPAGDLSLDSGEPALSVSSSGQTVAVWHRYDSASASRLAQASFGAFTQPSSPTSPTPPAPPTPPLPPPPPPAIATAIVPAAPIQAGAAIVLTAKVSGAVTALHWHFDNGPDDITGVNVNGDLQDSVRFHNFNRDLTATVTAIGPGGSHTYSRQFALPKPPDDKYSKIVQQAIESTPRVYATGDQATLLGNTRCGQVTEYTADQTITGCLRPVNGISDIPSRELGVIQSIARSAGLDPNDAQLMSTAIQRLDGYVGLGPAMLKGNWPVVPKLGADIMSFPGLGTLTSSNASLSLGGLNFGGGPSGFSLPIDPHLPDISLGSLSPPSLPDISGFPLIGDWTNVKLGDGLAKFKATLALPSFLSIGGVQLQASIDLSASPTHLNFDNITIGPIDVNLGGLTVSNFQISYNRPTDTWVGSGTICLLTGACLDMTPPAGEIKIQGGVLIYAGATVDFPGTGVPLFPGINLTKLGFAIGQNPTRLIGRGEISAVDLARLDGEIITAFPSTRTPFYLRRDEVGNDFPASLYSTAFTGPTIGAAADVFINVPVIENVKLGSGYFLYSYPNYVAVGGGVDIKVLDTVELYGNIAGQANFADKTLNLHGEAGACVHLVKNVCATAVVNISRAPNSGGGAGGCVGIGPLHIGGGIQWAHPTKPLIWPFDGCKWSPFKVNVRAASAAGANQRTIRVGRGVSPALKLYGQGAAPLVRVTGPGGQSLDSDSTDSGLDYSPDGKIRILRYESSTENFTVVGLQNDRPGTYTVTAMPGSVPFTVTENATDPPDARVTGSVTGTAASTQRVLTYDVRPRPDQSVTFLDVGQGGAAKVIGRVNGGGRGHIRFSSAPGRGRRTVEAQFSLTGVPAERMKVTSYRPPVPELDRPRPVHVTRRKGTLAVTWRHVAGAARYEVTVTSRKTGYQRFARTRGNRLVLTRIPLWVAGVVTVRAIDVTRQSQTAAGTFTAVGTKPTKLGKLAHCKLTGKAKKRKLTCTGAPAKHQPTKTRKPHPDKQHKH